MPYTHNNEGKSSLEEVEELSPYDILVGDRCWKERGLMSSDDRDLTMFIIQSWRSSGISSTEALAWLESRDLLDPDALMMGFAAFIHATDVPPPAPAAPETPLPIEWPYEREMLEAIAPVRSGRAA